MLASTTVQLWDVLRHRGLAGALWHAGQHISTHHQSKRKVDDCKVSLDCLKWELINASKAKQTNLIERAVKGRKYQGGEYIWGKYCISLSFTACENFSTVQILTNLPGNYGSKEILTCNFSNLTVLFFPPCFWCFYLHTMKLKSGQNSTDIFLDSI